MNIMRINNVNNNLYKKAGASNPAFCNKNNESKKYFDKKGELVARIYDPKNIFTISNNTNEKVGSAIVLTINDPEFKELKILVKDGTKDFKSKFFQVKVDRAELNASKPSFSGQVYGSIGINNPEAAENMKKAYNDFFDEGMYRVAVKGINSGNSPIKDDYNFFIPTDGNGTRFRDYTDLQGGVFKPAAILPGTFNGKPFKLVHATLLNFAKTGCLESDANFIEVEGGKGSAYALLEGLKTGDIPTDKPIVFCWGDNFSDIDLKKLIEHHEKHNAGLTVLGIATSYDKIQSLGGIKLDSNSASGCKFEIKGFKEKPKSHEDIMKSRIPGTHKHLASVGPFVISTGVLDYLKEEYSNNPSAFQNEKGEFDFSAKILTPLVQKLKDEDITDSNGDKIPMIAYIAPMGERWSDLGSTNDLIQEMKAVKLGKYANLPLEIQDSISSNVDDRGIIYQNDKAKELFEKFCKKYGVEIQNANIVVGASQIRLS